MRHGLVLGLVAGAIAAGCSPPGDGPTAPVPRFIAVGPGEGNSPDRIRIREQRKEDFTLTGVGCVSEPLVLTGTANFILQAQDNPADRSHFRLHTNLQGVSGVGEVTGTRYHLSNETNATLNYVAFLDPPKFETTQLFRYRLIGDGPHNNHWVDISLHTTVTPDGRISSTFFRAEERCATEG